MTEEERLPCVDSFPRWLQQSGPGQAEAGPRGVSELLPGRRVSGISSALVRSRTGTTNTWDARHYSTALAPPVVFVFCFHISSVHSANRKSLISVLLTNFYVVPANFGVLTLKVHEGSTVGCADMM